MSELFDGINHPKDLTNLSDLEKKHFPTIEVPEAIKAWEPFNVNVTIGKSLAHPNEGAHFIQWVELYYNEVLIGRTELTPTVYDMPVIFRVKLGKPGDLRVRSRCNLHGIWEGSTELKVV
jgi:superoxide reductase